MQKIDYVATCPFCGEVTTIQVSADSLDAYKKGALAQVAFADMTPAEREVIISGLCGNCQRIIFG